MEEQVKVEGPRAGIEIEVPSAAPPKAEKPKAPSKAEMKANGHSAEASFVAWSDWMSPEGAKWSVTLRDGIDHKRVMDLVNGLSLLTNEMVALGWYPCDKNVHVEYPPRSEEERIAALAEEKAAPVVKEKLLNWAKREIVTWAIKREVIKGREDKPGIDRVVATAGNAGLPPETALTHFWNWIEIVDGLALEAQHRAVAQGVPLSPATTIASTLLSTTGAPSAPPLPTPLLAGAPPPPLLTDAPVPAIPTQPGTLPPLAFDTIRVVAKEDGSPRVQFWRAGRKFPEIVYDLGAEQLLACSPVLVAKGWTVAHFVAVGSTYPVSGRVHYALSAKTGPSGKPYKDLTAVEV